MRSIWPKLNQSRQFYVLLLICVIAPLDVPLISPVLPTISEFFSVSDAQGSLVITAFATGAFLAAPVIGMLADRLRRRRLLVVLLLLYGGIGLSIPLAPTFEVLIGMRFVQGIFGGSILSSLGIALAGDLYEGLNRNKVVGYLSAALSIGVAIYPAVGGFLAEFGWQYPFLMYGWSILAAGLAYLWLDRSTTESEPGGDDRISVRETAGYLRDLFESIPERRALSLLGGVSASFLLLNGAVFTSVPFFLASNYGLPSGYIGSLLTIVLLVTAVVSTLSGRFSEYVSSPMLVVLGFAAYGIGLVAVAFARSVPVFVTVLVVFGIGHGLTLPAIATELTRLVPDRLRAGLLSLRTSAIVASQAAGPLLYTSLEPMIGYQALLLWSGGISVLGALVTGTIIKRGVSLTGHRTDTSNRSS